MVGSINRTYKLAATYRYRDNKGILWQRECHENTIASNGKREKEAVICSDAFLKCLVYDDLWCRYS